MNCDQELRTTKGAPHGHVQLALNFISESGLPCAFHALLNLQLAKPMDSHAIYIGIRSQRDKTQTNK